MRLTAAVTAFLVLAAGCEYGGPADNPVARNLTWFSYLGGEDIRESCGPGAPDRYRFVYNGTYDTQLRSYDLVLQPDGGAAMTAFARGEADLSRGVELPDIFSPWRGKRTQSEIAQETVAALRAALRRDRFRTSVPAGLRLPSDEFYWTAVACVDGKFHANAWLYPSERYKTLNFPEILLARDDTGVPFYAARPTDRRTEDPTLWGGDKRADPFYIELGRDGFVDMKALL